jgi:transcriptional regulator with XRE-family HTH domain
MKFGERIRQARKAKQYDLRTLAGIVGVHFTYLSKVENGRLDFGDYPSDGLILKLAKALDVDADELLLLAKRIPPDIRDRVIERPDAFRKLARLDDATLDWVLEAVDVTTNKQRSTGKKK